MLVMACLLIDGGQQGLHTLVTVACALLGLTHALILTENNNLLWLSGAKIQKTLLIQCATLWCQGKQICSYNWLYQ